MPTPSETVPNKALSGAELRTIMTERFKHLISQDCMLADHLAYGRISYDITIRLHVDNPFTVGPLVSSIASQPVGRNLLDAMPEMEAVEAGPPLTSPSPEAAISGSRLTHQITSPNRERLAVGLPVPADVRQRDGSIITEQLRYPPQPSDEGVQVEDITAETKRELGGK